MDKRQHLVAWWAHCLEAGELAPGEGWPGIDEGIPTLKLRHHYLEWCKAEGRINKLAGTQVTIMLKGILPDEYQGEWVHQISPTYLNWKPPHLNYWRASKGLRLPPLQECREYHNRRFEKE